MSKHLKLKFTNKSNESVFVFLEPVPEKFVVASNKSVVIHGIFESTEELNEFHLVLDKDGITVYAPGPFDKFIDCYVTENDIKLDSIPW
jgi:hypothetical protein